MSLDKRLIFPKLSISSFYQLVEMVEKKYPPETRQQISSRKSTKENRKTFGAKEELYLKIE
jgi:hypothetical protein